LDEETLMLRSNRVVVFLAVMFLFSSAVNDAWGNVSRQGDTLKDGSVFLYREKVEIYWNDWTGVRLPNSKVYISGSGKTVTFNGVLQLNCQSASGYSWLTASSSYGALGISERELNMIVPIQAVSAAFTVFCDTDF
jgi:hypothetical protein